MEKALYLSFEECCVHYQVEATFIEALEAHGLVEAQTMDQQKFIAHDHLTDLERFITMHYDLDINIQGIEVISRLLHQMESMQNELRGLRNRLEE